MTQLTLIKLGGSLITDKDKPFTAREEVILRLVKEIKSSLKNYQGKIILAHGSGSFGHSVAAKYQTKLGNINKSSLKGLILTADAAIQINRIVVKQCLKVGLSVVSLAPLSFIVARNNEVKDCYLTPLKELLKNNLIPIIYGDVVMDQKTGWTIFSAETSLNIIAQQLRKEYFLTKVIHCGITDGVYDDQGKTIPTIDQVYFEKIKKMIRGSESTDVTGGMLHKVTESLAMASQGAKCLIINGNIPGNLKKAILGQKVVGTRIIGG